MNQSPEKIEFLNPFAEAGPEAIVDVEAAFEVITERYLSDEIEHDYTADNYVRDTETLMLEATFQDKLDIANAIAAQMGAMCQHDHSLMNSVNESGLLGQHSGEHDHAHKRQDEDDEDEFDSKGRRRRRKHR